MLSVHLLNIWVKLPYVYKSWLIFGITNWNLRVCLDLEISVKWVLPNSLTHGGSFGVRSCSLPRPWRLITCTHQLLHLLLVHQDRATSRSKSPCPLFVIITGHLNNLFSHIWIPVSRDHVQGISLLFLEGQYLIVIHSLLKVSQVWAVSNCFKVSQLLSRYDSLLLNGRLNSC